MDSSPSTDSLIEVVQRLNGLWVPYMVTGSVAAIAYGLNRMTGDVDIVVDLSNTTVQEFCNAFEGDFFVQESMVEDALKRGMMFNILPLKLGGKFDIIPLRDDPFEHAKFERREPIDWHGFPIFIASAPDLVLSKLHWARDSHSIQQFSDVRVIMASGFVDEHDDYFRNWLSALGLEDVLDLARSARHDA